MLRLAVMSLPVDCVVYFRQVSTKRMKSQCNMRTFEVYCTQNRKAYLHKLFHVRLNLQVGQSLEWDGTCYNSVMSAL